MNDPNILLKRGLLAISLGPFLVGLLEALLVGADPLFAALFYGAIAALLGGLLLFISGFLCPKKRDKALTERILRLLATFFWGIPALVVGRFLIFRNYFAEHQAESGRASLLAFLFALISSLVIYSLVSFTERHLSARVLSFSYIIPLIFIFGTLAFLLRGEEVHGQAKSKSFAQHPGGTILIIADTLRADVLPFYSAQNALGAPAQVPNLAALAKEGLVFENSYAAASWTKPAVATIMTGLLPRQHQAISKKALLKEEHETMAELFKKGGYNTLAVSNNSNLGSAFGFNQGFDEYRELKARRYFGAPQSATNLSVYNMYRLIRERYLPFGRRAEYFYQPAEVVSLEALNLLDTRSDERPFFLYLHYMDPHDPYFAKNGASYARVATPFPAAAMAKEMYGAYKDEVERLDEGLGALFAGLKERGLWGKVQIVFTADHGEEFAEHGHFYHGTSLYEEQLKVPFIIFGPDIAAGRQVTMARQSDILPTLAALNNLAANPMWAGMDLFSGTAPTIHLAEEDHQGHELTAIISGFYSLIKANKDNPRGLKPLELYDLAADSAEKHDLSATEKYRSTADELLRYEKIFAKGGSAAEEGELSPETAAQLKALGYIE